MRLLKSQNVFYLNREILNSPIEATLWLEESFI